MAVGAGRLLGTACVAAGTPGKRCGGEAERVVGVVVMLCLDEWRDLHRGDVASACLNAVFVGGLCVRCVVL